VVAGRVDGKCCDSVAPIHLFEYEATHNEENLKLGVIHLNGM
jgi:hypothetical protein